MIATTAILIRTALRAALDAANSGGGADSPEYTVMGNIAQTDTAEGTALRDRVVISVVNIAEEATFKNAPHYERTADGTRYRNAPKFLNAYMLFSANYTNYETALRRLSQTITFFQGKNVFTLQNSPLPQLLDVNGVEIKLILELVALTFEQVNYLWASLGGKQIPFALYKVRLVKVQADRTTADAPVIEEITGSEAKV